MNYISEIAKLTRVINMHMQLNTQQTTKCPYLNEEGGFVYAYKCICKCVHFFLWKWWDCNNDAIIIETVNEQNNITKLPG